MSWSASFLQPVTKSNADGELDRLYPNGLTGNLDIDGPVHEQLALAKAAARELLKGIPGPRVCVTLAGHANGVGWHEKEGWANDTITVSVTQAMREYVAPPMPSDERFNS